VRILFVENHAVFAEQVCQKFLSKYLVRVVPGLAAARQQLRDSQFDLVLTDFDLDDGKGDQLVKEIKARFPELKVIAVSSHDQGNNALKRVGADAVCGKMEFDRIGETIESLFL
jgi:DNA-binding NarL/FixJ family response regulator